MNSESTTPKTNHPSGKRKQDISPHETPAGDASRRWRGARLGGWLAATAVCSAIAIVCLWLERQRDAAGPLLVTGDDSAGGFGIYVREQVCAECHPSQAASYAQTAHANTFRPSVVSEIAAALDGWTFQDPVRDDEYRYRFDARTGLSVSIEGRFDGASFPLTYAFGSGRRATTFLTLIPNRLGETTGIEHRVSVHPDADGLRLGLTGGYPERKPEQDIDHFGRVLRGDDLDRCVECHTTGGEIAGQEIRGFLPSVSCQNCHGPRREHVIAMQRPESQGAPSAASRRWTAIEQIRTCSRCHPRQGMEEERSVAPDHVRSVRLQATEFLQSRCYQESPDHLSCSSCHDPHQIISRDSEYYVQRCLDCHSEPGDTSCSVSPRTDCIRCHMPLEHTHDGIPFHDHRIRVPAASAGEDSQ
jgi:hypothetical protein